jgi:hypothetical protein
MADMPPAFWQGIPPSALMEPRAYRSSAWSGHVPFAFWIVDALRPRQLVELGTWWGMSYLAFCQAVDVLGTGTRAFAVDTWQGDEHTGPLATQALAALKAEHDPRYAGFSELLRMRFEEAVERFEPGSIDLLHIDGLHTYEAVKSDWEMWRPKLSNRAVVLFHDTQVRERGFGVYRLWEELTRDYPGVEFLHEHGLGVLGVGSDLPEGVRSLLAAAERPDELQQVRDTFARLGRTIRITQTASEHEQGWSKLRQNLGVRVVMKAQRMVGLVA